MATRLGCGHEQHNTRCSSPAHLVKAALTLASAFCRRYAACSCSCSGNAQVENAHLQTTFERWRCPKQHSQWRLSATHQPGTTVGGLDTLKTLRTVRHPMPPGAHLLQAARCLAGKRVPRTPLACRTAPVCCIVCNAGFRCTSN